MRDLDKVREQEGLMLTAPQAYLIVSLTLVSMCLLFVFGYYLGRQSAPLAQASVDPLISEDIQNESIAALLSRASEEEASAGKDGQINLQFQAVLPSREEVMPPLTSPPASAPLPALEPPEPVLDPDEEEDVPDRSPSGGAAVVPEVQKETPGSGASPAPSGKTTGTALSGTAKPAEEAPKRGTEAAATRTPETSTPSGSESTRGAALTTDLAGNTPAPDKSKESVAARPDPRAPVGTAKEGATGTPSPSAAKSQAKLTASRPKDPREGGNPPPKTAAGPLANREESKTSAEATAPKSGTPTPAVEKPPARSARSYTVQVSSYQESAIADKLVRQLSAQGFSAYKVAAQVNGQTWYRVRVGSFSARGDAEQEMERLKAARSELNPMIAIR